MSLPKAFPFADLHLYFLGAAKPVWKTLCFSEHHMKKYSYLEWEISSLKLSLLEASKPVSDTATSACISRSPQKHI